MIVFDIETGPLPIDHLRSSGFISPVDPAEILTRRPPAEFDPAAVKVGNLKDAAKIEAKVAEAKAAHAKALADFDAGFEQLCRTEQEQREAEVISKAALRAETGQVLAIGYWRSAEQWSMGAVAPDCEEGEVIAAFWGHYRRFSEAKQRMIGFNIFGFDLPFLIRRSYILGVTVPASIIERERYWSDTFVDLMARWQCGDRSTHISLDKLCRCLGLPGKNGDGAGFAALWNGTAEQRAAAVEYLRNDLSVTAACAERLGVG